MRAYEDFAREQGLEFNLIVNSERGGQESDELFYRETLQMVDTYLQGGRTTDPLVRAELVSVSQADRRRRPRPIR